MLLHPAVIFLAVWMLTMFCYLLRVAEWMPDRPDLMAFLFLFSTACFLLGFLAARGRRLPGPHLRANEDFQVHLRRLRVFQLLLAILVAGITAYNVLTAGPPPALARFVSAPTTYYLRYGRFKGVLLPAAGIIFLCSLYERRLVLRAAAMVFASAAFVTYVTRESFVATILEAFFVYAITRRLSDARIAARIAVLGVCTLPLMHFMGDLRTDRQELLQAVEVRAPYRNMNTGLLWSVSYASLPMANLLWFVEHADKHFHGRICLDRILPTFLWKAEYAEDYRDLLPNPRNTVPTYLGLVYLDFGYAGIAAINVVLGALGGLLYRLTRTGRYAMSYAVYLGMLSLLFFQDFLLHFPFLVTLLLSLLAARICLLPRRRSGTSAEGEAYPTGGSGARENAV